jgi:hypothetical protein
MSALTAECNVNGRDARFLAGLALRTPRSGLKGRSCASRTGAARWNVGEEAIEAPRVVAHEPAR